LTNILHTINTAAGEVGGNACLEQTQSLLLRGKREEAVKCALSGGDHALALLIASLCGPNTYHTAARYYIQTNLTPGTPLHTATSLFANQIQSPEEAEDQMANFWNDRAESLGESWQHHLATILSNQTRGWKKVVTALGDELLYAGRTHAAHFCYLVSGRPITAHTDTSSRLALVGCDHRVKMHVALVTKESWEAYMRTEALEWAKRKGNPNAAITTLQPFKFRYAVLLADFGFEQMAKMYIDSIRKCTGLYPTSSAKATKSKTTNIYQKDFANSLDVFEDRLCVSLGVPNVNVPPKQTPKLGLASVLSKIVPKSVAAKEDEIFHEATKTETSFVDDANEDPDLSFVSATSNILDVTANSLATARSSHSKYGQSKSTAATPAPSLMSPLKETEEKAPRQDSDVTNAPQPSFMTTPVVKRSDYIALNASYKSPQMPNLSGGNETEPLFGNKMNRSEATPTKTKIGEAPKSAPVTMSTPSSMSTPVDRKPKNEQPPSSGSSKLKIFDFYFPQSIRVVSLTFL
jgi:hypothetical protein